MNDVIQTAPVDSNNAPIQEAPVSHMKTEDTYSYKGWLFSDFFYKRALAVLGYHIVAQIMIALFFSVIILAVILLGIII